MRRPPLVQRAGQRLASRGTPYFRERSANMFGLGRAGSSTVAAPADSGKSTVFLLQAPGVIEEPGRLADRLLLPDDLKAHRAGPAAAPRHGAHTRSGRPLPALSSPPAPRH